MYSKETNVMFMSWDMILDWRRWGVGRWVGWVGLGVWSGVVHGVKIRITAGGGRSAYDSDGS